MAGLVSVPKNWATNCNYILRDGWIDIAGQCANTISVRIVGPVGCKVRWRGVCMVNETLDMVGE